MYGVIIIRSRRYRMKSRLGVLMNFVKEVELEVFSRYMDI